MARRPRSSARAPSPPLNPLFTPPSRLSISHANRSGSTSGAISPASLALSERVVISLRPASASCRRPRQGSAQAYRHPHPIRSPALRDRFQLGGVGLVRQAICHTNRLKKAPFARRQLVHSAQGSQSHKLRSELADSLQPLQPRQRLVLRQSAQLLGVELAA